MLVVFSCLNHTFLTPPLPHQTLSKPYPSHPLHPIHPFPSPTHSSPTPSTPSPPPQPHSITSHTLLLFPAAEACPPPQEIFTPRVIAGIVGGLVIFALLIIVVTVTVMFVVHKRYHELRGVTCIKRQSSEVISLQELHQPNVVYLCRYSGTCLNLCVLVT